MQGEEKNLFQKWQETVSTIDDLNDALDFHKSKLILIEYLLKSNDETIKVLDPLKDKVEERC